MKITNIIFVDTGKTLAKIFNEDGTADIVSYDKKDKRFVGWKEYDIEKAPNDFNNAELREKATEIKISVDDITDLDITGILDLKPTKNQLFELKLKMFDLPEVKLCKKRSIKSTLRKSNDLTEIFHCLHEIRLDVA